MTRYQLTIDGKVYDVEVGDVSASPVQVMVNGVAKSVAFVVSGAAMPASASAPVTAPVAAPVPTEPAKPAPVAAPAATPPAAVAGTKVSAPMPGKILSVVVKVGQSVKQGDTVCTLEAMKMEMPISSTGNGIVKAVHVNVGQMVAYDDPLVTLG